MAEKEYIEREALKSKLKNMEATSPNKVYQNAMEDMIYYFIPKIIDEIPTADVALVRHGRWKKSKGNERPTENGFVHNDKYVCDCCGWGCCCETKLDFSFCPNCGAKMDGNEVE